MFKLVRFCVIARRALPDNLEPVRNMILASSVWRYFLILSTLHQKVDFTLG